MTTTTQQRNNTGNIADTREDDAIVFFDVVVVNNNDNGVPLFMLPEATAIVIDIVVVVVHILNRQHDCPVAVRGRTTHVTGWTAHGFVQPPLCLATKRTLAPPWRARPPQGGEEDGTTMKTELDGNRQF